MKNSKTYKKGRVFYHSVFSVLSAFLAVSMVSFITCTEPAAGQNGGKEQSATRELKKDQQPDELDRRLVNSVQDPKGARGPAMGLGCMLQINDSKVTEKSTAAGVTLVYESLNGQVELLQKRIQAIAEHHNLMQAEPNRPGLAAGRGYHKMPAASVGARRMVDSVATVEVTETGANLLFKPVHAEELAKLTEQIHQRLAGSPAAGCLQVP